MTDFFPYIIEANLLIVFLFSMYWIVFRRDTFFVVNRMVLLGIMCYSAVLPALEFTLSGQPQWVTIQLQGIELSEYIANAQASKSGFGYILSWIYIGGLVFFALRFSISLVLLIKRILNSPKKRYKGYSLLELGRGEAPFSFFNWLFLDPFIPNEEANKIVRHELVHVRQLHSFDIVLAEILCTFFWFNPVCWLFRTELKAVHEFEADGKVVEKETDIKEYTRLLIDQHLLAPTSSWVNGFSSYSLLTKRIMMLKKKRTHQRRHMSKLLLWVPVIFASIYMSSCTKQLGNTDELAANEEKSTEYVEAKELDKLPEYSGGIVEMHKYLMQKIHYSDVAKEAGLEGTVHISFKVSDEGKVHGATVIKSLDSELDRIALNAISDMPNWSPGLKDGKAVNVELVLPIKFALPKDEGNS